MSVGPRSRSRFQNESGTYRDGNSTWKTKTRTSTSEYMDDFVNQPGFDHLLHHQRMEITGSTLNVRTTPSFGIYLDYVDAPSSFSSTNPSIGYLDPDTSDIDAWSGFLANTNPSRPEFGLSVFLGELKDMPGMLRQAGRYTRYIAENYKDWGSVISSADNVRQLVSRARPTFGNSLPYAKELASASLGLQFGWAPLLSDLEKIVDFIASTDKRSNELERLYSGRGLKRRMDLGEWKDTISGNFNVCPKPVQSVAYECKRHTRRWGVVRWSLTEQSPPIPSGGDLRARLLGINSGAIASTLWELLPWSWLIDYFSNIGDLVKLTNNHLAAKPSGCIMTMRKTLCSHNYARLGSGSVNGRITAGSRIQILKQRTPMNGLILPQFGVPLLGAKQLSILGSIATLRIR